MCRDWSMIIAWKELGRFWFEKAPYQLKRTIFISKVIGAALSGSLSYCFSKAQYAALDRRMIGFLRAMMKGKAHSVNAQGENRTLTDSEVLRFWRVLPLWHEDSVRRVKWLKSIVFNPEVNYQLVAAVWGRLEVRKG